MEELAGLAIPTEIIVEILSRLTVKSLCRFRCVSKPWRSLISSTKFIALHDKKALEDKQVFFERRRVVFTVPFSAHPSFSSLYSLDLDEFLTHADHHDGLVTATKLDFVHQEISANNFCEFYTYLYACNNLLLLKVFCGFYLINPATREIRKVPKIPSWWIDRQFVPQSSINGFGFDYSTNEYKVVMGQYVASGENGIAGVLFSVYTLETDSWRNIERLFPYRPLRCPGFFLNGAVHWLGYSTVGDFFILSFRLAEKEVREIQLPRFIDFQSWAARLGVFRNDLCISDLNEFWVMKDYGVRESWIRMKISTPWPCRHMPFGFSTKSHDLVMRDKSFVMCNFEEDSCWDIPIRDIPRVGRSFGTYVEGLFSLKRSRAGCEP